MCINVLEWLGHRTADSVYQPLAPQSQSPDFQKPDILGHTQHVSVYSSLKLLKVRDGKRPKSRKIHKKMRRQAENSLEA